MPATVVVKEANGSGPTWTTVTQVRFKTKDEYARDSAYPTPIPNSGYNYSYWKSLALDLSGTFTKINNVRIYSDGAGFGTGITTYVGVRDSGDNGCPTANYQQATGTERTTGYDMADASNGHAYYKGQTTKKADLFGYVVGSQLTLDSADHTTAEKTKHAVLQWRIGSTATRGLVTAESITFSYDEI